MTETEARAFSFEIDHYQPMNHGGTDVYGNLMYACGPCNGRKLDHYPRAEARAKGLYYIRIDVEDPRDHIGDMSAGNVVHHKTSTGEFNISELDLNRLALRRIRQIRREFGHASDVVTHGLRALGMVRLDELPMAERASLLRTRAQLNHQQVAIDEQVRKLVSDVSRSELVDPDPETRDRQRDARKYLLSLGAVWVPRSEKTPKLAKRRTRRS